MVNGAEQRLAADALFAADRLAHGHIPDTAAELSEAHERALLVGRIGPLGSDAYRKARQSKASPSPISLLPPECQGAACHARAALAALAASCAADRGCREIITGQIEGQKT